MKINSVIFDMDGVIIDSAYSFFKAYEIVLKENYNIDNFTFEYFQPLFGQRSDESFIKIQNDFNIKFDDEKKIWELKDKTYKDIISKYKVIPHFTETVKLIKSLKDKNYKIAVASSSVSSIVDLCLKNIKIYDLFDVLITGDQVQKGKPNPEVFLKAVKELDSNLDESIIIEDSPPGLRASINANIKCFILKAEYAKNDWYKGAYKIFDIKNTKFETILKEIEAI